MTILPVPLTDFRGDMAKYLNMLGAVEIHVTKHGRTIAVVRKPEDARKVEDPPGEERVRLMEALLSGEGKPTKITPVKSTPGDPRYHTGVAGAAGSTMGRGGAGGEFSVKPSTAIDQYRAGNREAVYEMTFEEKMAEFGRRTFGPQIRVTEFGYYDPPTDPAEIAAGDAAVQKALDDGTMFSIGADPSTGPDLTAATVYQKHEDGIVEAVDPAPFDPFDFMGGI